MSFVIVDAKACLNISSYIGYTHLASTSTFVVVDLHGVWFSRSTSSIIVASFLPFRNFGYSVFAKQQYFLLHCFKNTKRSSPVPKPILRCANILSVKVYDGIRYGKQPKYVFPKMSISSLFDGHHHIHKNR